MTRTKSVLSKAMRWRTHAIAAAVLAMALSLLTAGAASAAPGDFVAETSFSQDCSSGLGVGVAYDGAGHLWVSCYGSNPDLLRTDVNTGVVDQTYNIANGLGALAYDATRNALWAGPGGDYGNVRLIQLDAGKSVTGSSIAFNAGGDGSGLDDGLGYDATDDTLYISPDGSTVIHHYKTDGTKIGDINWSGNACYNSGVAIGGNDLFEGADGCSHVWVVDKTSNAALFDFSTVTAQDPNHRDEGLSCDPTTFAAQSKQVMWSKEAYSPNRAIAFEIPSGTCGAGGRPPGPPGDQAISATGGNKFTGTEPAAVSGTVATFTDPDTSATAGEYSASVDWGDGSTSTGTVSGSGGSFSVSGSHTYADEGSYTITVTITDTDNAANTATVTDSASIADAALSASGITPTPVSGQSFSGPVANFTDANSTATTADFTATIDWGDGSAATGGTVSGSGGSFTVNGSHTYTGTGYYTIKVHIVDDGGSTADATTKVLIYGTASGGNFVIGDKSAGIGNAVTFWSPQWWSKNSLSGGVGPASFKGFEDSPAVASCGTAWTTDPGNSTPPPAGPLPDYMLVIVSSKVSKSGAAISGDTVHLVVVKTDPGYAPSVGHAGTGTEVAQVC